MERGTLHHWRTFLRADDEHRYIPFMLGHGGMPSHKGWHYLNLGTEGGIEEAKAHAGRVFPDAEIVEIWEIDIMGELIGKTPVWRSSTTQHTVPI